MKSHVLIEPADELASSIVAIEEVICFDLMNRGGGASGRVIEGCEPGMACG